MALRERLVAEEPLLGTWVNGRDPAVVETLGAVGFDLVAVDLEHGEIGLHHLPDMLRAAAASGAASLVRVSRLEPSEIGRALDAGPDGVIVPNVTSAAEAEAAVRAVHYPPRGLRGAAPTGRGARYGVTPFADYRRRVEDEVVLVLQVEGREGIAGLDGILEVGGVDVLFIGPFDLSQHLGVPGETDHPEVVAAMRGVAAAAGRRGVVTGTWAASAEAARRWAEAGVRLVTVSSSTAIFTHAATSLLRAARVPATHHGRADHMVATHGPKAPPGAVGRRRAPDT
jgi:4-hydroxy-2-oxoheptanedioate aldolase